jgi:hypothetical protein
MDLAKALEALKFDVRMKEWNLKQGVLKQNDSEENAKTLKDLAPQSVPLEFQEEVPDSYT